MIFLCLSQFRGALTGVVELRSIQSVPTWQSWQTPPPAPLSRSSICDIHPEEGGVARRLAGWTRPGLTGEGGGERSGTASR